MGLHARDLGEVGGGGAVSGRSPGRRGGLGVWVESVEDLLLGPIADAYLVQVCCQLILVDCHLFC